MELSQETNARGRGSSSDSFEVLAALIDESFDADVYSDGLTDAFPHLAAITTSTAQRPPTPSTTALIYVQKLESALWSNDNTTASNTDMNDPISELEHHWHHASATSEREATPIVQEKQQQPSKLQVYQSLALPRQPPCAPDPAQTSALRYSSSLDTFSLTSNPRDDGSDIEGMSVLDGTTDHLDICRELGWRPPQSNAITMATAHSTSSNLALGRGLDLTQSRIDADMSQLTEGADRMSLEYHGTRHSLLETTSRMATSSSLLNQHQPQWGSALALSPTVPTVMIQNHDILVFRNENGGYLPTLPLDEHLGNRLYHQDIAARHVEYTRTGCPDVQSRLCQEVLECVSARQGRFLRPLLVSIDPRQNLSWCVMNPAEIKAKIWSDFHQPCYVDHFNRECDIMMGRGEQNAVNNGHKRYLAKRDELRPRYRASKDNKSRNYIAQQLVDDVYDNGGRFLERKVEDGTLRYRVVNNDTALEKAKQTFRKSRHEPVAL
jgi:hypothetical protein